MQNPSASLDVREREALAEKSYREVLDATKHQDDKIGRFLTAIAFMFTGAIAFGIRPDLLGLRISFENQDAPIPTLFLGLFLGLSVLAVLLLLVAIGPNLKLPRSERPHGRSWIFFLSIAGKTEAQWREQWVASSLNHEAVTWMFASEAHNLATKTEFKYARTNEARAAFTLGLLFLVLSLVIFFESSARGVLNIGSLPWDLGTRSLVAFVISVFAVTLAYDYLRLDQELDEYVEPGHRASLIWPFWLLLVTSPLYVWLVLLPTPPVSKGFAVLIAASGPLLATAAVILRADGNRGLVWPTAVFIALLVIGVATYVALSKGWGELQLATPIACVVLLETPRVVVSSRTLRRRLGSLGVSFASGYRAELRAWWDRRGHAGRDGAR